MSEKEEEKLNLEPESSDSKGVSKDDSKGVSKDDSKDDVPIDEVSKDILEDTPVLDPALITSTQETRRLKDMVKMTLREGNRVGALGLILGAAKEYAIPLVIFATLIIILLSFRAILLPFILALAFVYLMEPVVSFLKRRTKLPRFLSVLLVYISLIGVTTTVTVIVIPPFVREILNFAETFPAEAQKFRSEKLPSVNEDFQEFLRAYLPGDLSKKGHKFDFAKKQLRLARKAATKNSAAFGNARVLIKHAYSQELKYELEEDEDGGITRKYSLVSPTSIPAAFEIEETSNNWTIPGEASAGPILIKSGEDGTLSVDLSNVALEVEKIGETKWLIKKQEVASLEEQGGIEDLFNLEKTLDGLIEDVVSISNQRLASVVEFLRKAVVGVVGAIVGILLTLMVAAFISIDLPRVMGFFRGVVPKKSREGYDVLLKNMNRGLAGVVRGQLVICLVNGFLTWIGLWFLGVKFSVLLAVIAGILSLIPVFGTIISTIPIVIVGLIDGFMLGLLALVWILLVHGVEAYVLNPKIIGNSAHIHPVIVIFALLAGESAFGLIGALLAIPTASIILTLFDFFRTRAWETTEEART